MANIITTLSLEMSANWYVSKKLSGVGRVGENTVTKLIIEPTEILDGVTYELEIMSADGSKNVAELTVDGDVLYLILTANMLTVGGITKMQVRAVFADNSIKKSNIFELKVSRSISATDYYEEYAVTIFDQLVAECQEIIDGAEGYVERAETAAENAEDYSESASTSATSASASATTASTSATTAVTASETATAASTSATASAETATTAAASASASASTASTASESAQTASTSASTSAETAVNASASATTSASNAEASATTATTAANNASTSATAASTSASNAATSETNASASAANASTSETNAANSATSASTSATSASESATSAANSATASATSATNAAASATTATNAATTATNAANSVVASANQINSNTKRIENLEAINKGITYVENVQSGTANSMTVSANNIGAYGALNYVGGASIVVDGAIQNAPVTSITSGTDTFAIPSEVQALNGYGLGIDSTYYNNIDFATMKFKKNVNIIDLGDLTWLNEESALSAGRYRASMLDYAPKLLVSPVCSAYTGIATASFRDLTDGDIAITNSEERPLLRIFDTSKAGYTSEQIKTALSGVYMIYALSDSGKTETDISSYFADNFIKVSAGGTVTFVNEHNLAVPYSLTTNDSV